MPLFDLKCTACGNEFQKMVSFSKIKEAACPKCGHTNNERIYKANIKGPISSGGSSSSSAPAGNSGFT
ncbi:FmdB family zinc ribbon protein [Melghiribacillus thermohalophilus]|uniref:FmdB family zinc ribbon protein n=1 Tax=Melghiribacillus thermohalophilus TaxID=1324956 RepID=UPI001049F8D7|nr:zinc ribbon domain-containing protein [Melghiribacillus thermohalophilus]